MYLRVTQKWNHAVEPLYILDTLGTASSVDPELKEVSSFQGLFCTHLYAAGTIGILSVLIKGDVLISEVSL